MSKSKKNVVDPSSIIELYGADTARWFMLSDSPPDRDLEWTDTGIVGSYKFINRVWDISKKIISLDESAISENKTSEALGTLVNDSVINVTKNIEDFHFNKGVANIYKLINSLQKITLEKSATKKDLLVSIKTLSLLLQPFVPHLSEEIWKLLGGEGLSINESWPKPLDGIDKKTYKVAIQINGKVRSFLSLDFTPTEEKIIDIVKSEKKVQDNLKDKKIIKIIYVPNRVINYVVK